MTSDRSAPQSFPRNTFRDGRVGRHAAGACTVPLSEHEKRARAEMSVHLRRGRSRRLVRIAKGLPLLVACPREFRGLRSGRVRKSRVARRVHELSRGLRAEHLHDRLLLEQLDIGPRRLEPRHPRRVLGQQRSVPTRRAIRVPERGHRAVTVRKLHRVESEPDHVARRTGRCVRGLGPRQYFPWTLGPAAGHASSRMPAARVTDRRCVDRPAPRVAPSSRSGTVHLRVASR